jgi:hypothetical protein
VWHAPMALKSISERREADERPFAWGC